MCSGRSRTVRSGGRSTRENAGISSERGARNSSVESLRIPGEGSSAQGKSGPKSRPKGVDDGQSVDNPIPPNLHEAVTQKDSQSALMVERVQAVRLMCSKVHTSKGWAVMGS